MVWNFALALLILFSSMAQAHQLNCSFLMSDQSVFVLQADLDLKSSQGAGTLNSKSIKFTVVQNVWMGLGEEELGTRAGFQGDQIN